MFRTKSSRETEIESEMDELRKWFSDNEARWLIREHPDVARMAADPASGMQSIFAAGAMIDAEYVPLVMAWQAKQRLKAPKRTGKQR